MNSVNKTLYIPLYGKAFVSRSGIILHDPTAEAIWAAEGFPLKGKASSKWLAYYMGMRAAVFDRWVRKRMNADPEAVILHLGCGMDSRVHRAAAEKHLWFDMDFPQVIQERRRYFAESAQYRMIGCDIRSRQWLAQIPAGSRAIIVMEGISMYLTVEELKGMLTQLTGHFSQVQILMDSYTTFAAKASRYKNPINEVGITAVYGFDDPQVLTAGTALHFEAEHDLTPADLIDQLQGMERRFFKGMFAGSMAKKLYRLYEYRSEV